MQYWKTVDLQKGHAAKADITVLHQIIQEGQAEVVSLATPRQKQWRRKQNLLNF